MDWLTYLSALLAVFLLLGLFALVMRAMTQGGMRGGMQGQALPRALQRFLPRNLRFQVRGDSEGFAITAVRVIDARRKIVAVDFADKRYILLLSHQNELLLDTLTRETSPPVTAPPPPSPSLPRQKRERQPARRLYAQRKD